MVPLIKNRKTNSNDFPNNFCFVDECVCDEVTLLSNSISRNFAKKYVMLERYLLIWSRSLKGHSELTNCNCINENPSYYDKRLK